MRKLPTHTLTILTTNTCTAECGHCTVRSSPERRGRLDLGTICKAVDELHRHQALSVVVFAGGEPTLMKETLLDAIAYCDSLGILTRLVTNASWAISAHAAAKMVRRLREAGLAEINISADDHHLPFISFDNVKRAWKACQGKGFINVSIANCSGPNSKITPDFIRRELDEPHIRVRFDDEGEQHQQGAARADGTIYMLSNGLLQRIGRGRDELKDEDLRFPESPSVLETGCQWIVRSAALAPSGHLVSCCGIEAAGNEVLDFGDVRQGDVNTLAARAEEDVLVRAISALGPYRLLKLAESLDRRSTVKARPRYASMCEACEDLVRQPAALGILREHRALLERDVSATLK